MSSKREELVRECFNLKRDFNYWPFRRAHWQQVEMVATFPNPAEREKVLWDFWECDAEKRFAEYRTAVADLSLVELEAEKEQWIDRLSLVSEREYQSIVAEAASRTPANDNHERGREH